MATFTFPTDSNGKAGAVKELGGSFHIPAVIYGADGVTPISATNRLPVASQMTSGPIKGFDLVKVTAAGTAIQLPNITCSVVTVTALKANTGSIYAGGSGVTNAKFGQELEKKESFDFYVSNANEIWIDASVSGEGISYVAV
jgi:hypothetical protein